jgi:DNA-binding NtrC family response regulator
MTNDLETTTTINLPESNKDLVSLRRYQLVVLGKDGNRRTYTLGKKSKVKMGKKSDNDIVISNDRTVSREHVVVEMTDDNQYILKDLNSTNGTLINGMKVKEAFLSQGDIIKVGETEIEFQSFDEKVQIEPSKSNEFGGLVGRSKKMRQIFGVLERISKSQATVIIEGETGTGKELVARAIHDNSPRKDKPFVVFDCSAVAPNLIESELFGHVKGAFTGAAKDRAGAFEVANGGTIFLDEIGELSIDLQPKLLRALEQREVKRVGGTHPSKVDVRVLCATNRNLKDEVAADNFREDLYYRLSVVKIQVPALRERLEDIPIIVERLLEKGRYNKKSDGDFYVTRVEDDALKILQRYQWPGNVRELNNIVERAVSFSVDGKIKGPDLQFVFSEMESGEEATVRMNVADTDMPFKEAKQVVVENFEKEYLEELLNRNQGNVSKASREAKVDRKHLRNLLIKYGLLATNLSDEDE